MIAFKVIHHVPGRIRLEVPTLKGLSLEGLKKLSIIPIPAGVKDIRPNPVTGSLVIRYDPGSIDIMKYLEETVSSKEIQNMIKETE